MFGMNTVSIGGVSSDTVRLRFDKLPIYPAAAQKYSTYEIPGAGENMTVASGDYEDIELTLTAYLVGSTTINDVYNWLRGGTQLILSTQPDVYTEIKEMAQVSPSREGWSANRIEIGLKLSPFKYRISNNPVTLPGSGTELQTVGNIFSKPVWALTGTSGTVEFSVNGTTLTIEDAPENVYIDTNLQEVYTEDENGAAVSILGQTTGEFWSMVLVPGALTNYISWSGTVDKVIVIKNERWV